MRRARKVDQAWNDLYTSFEYHDHYWKLLAAHYNLDLQASTSAN